MRQVLENQITLESEEECPKPKEGNSADLATQRVVQQQVTMTGVSPLEEGQNPGPLSQPASLSAQSNTAPGDLRAN